MRWTSWANSLRSLHVEARLDAINHRVNSTFPYATDLATWGAPNHWSTPPEVVLKGATDCKGSAVMKFWLAVQAGVDESDLALFVVDLRYTHRMHAVLVANINSKTFVLDSLQDSVSDATALRDYRILLTADLYGLRLFIHRSAERDQSVVADASPSTTGRPKER